MDRGILDLAQAWALISTRPAQVMGLHDRGEIALGRRADLVVVHAASRKIEATICAGRLTHLSGQAALRFMGLGRAQTALAAE